jgi:uncharacterized protein YkwD
VIIAATAAFACSHAGAAAAASACAGANATPTGTNSKLLVHATRCLINRERTANRLKKVHWNRRLANAGRLHLRAMLRGHFFGHRGPGEPALGARLRKVRYRGGGGEILGTGDSATTPALLVAAWMQSPIHREEILGREYRRVGIVVAQQIPDFPGAAGATYVAEFGTD